MPSAPSWMLFLQPNVPVKNCYCHNPPPLPSMFFPPSHNMLEINIFFPFFSPCVSLDKVERSLEMCSNCLLCAFPTNQLINKQSMAEAQPCIHQKLIIVLAHYTVGFKWEASIRLEPQLSPPLPSLVLSNVQRIYLITHLITKRYKRCLNKKRPFKHWSWENDGYCCLPQRCLTSGLTVYKWQADGWMQPEPRWPCLLPWVTLYL